MTEYLTYPFKTMRITQNYNGTVSHKPHKTGNVKDYPIDEGGKDAGRDAVYARCQLVVKRIYGVGNGGVNTLWLESAEKVKLANGKTDYITLLLTHPNDADLKKLKVGQVFEKGDVICSEGTDGATGNHIHLSVGMGKMTGNGWAQNSKGKWVLTTTSGTVKPENAFYIDPKFTTVKDAKGLKFKQLPKKTSTKPKYTVGDYKVTGANVLNVRTGPSKKYTKKAYVQLTKSARDKIKKLTGDRISGYVRNLTFTVLEVKGSWGKTPSGWVCLDYCTKI